MSCTMRPLWALQVSLFIAQMEPAPHLLLSMAHLVLNYMEEQTGHLALPLARPQSCRGLAESILFNAQNLGGSLGGVFLVSLGGQSIPFFALSTGSNYTLYGGNIPAFGGETEQLTFSALAGGNN